MFHNITIEYYLMKESVDICLKDIFVRMRSREQVKEFFQSLGKAFI